MTYSSVFVTQSAPSLIVPDYCEIFRYMGYSLHDRIAASAKFSSDAENAGKIDGIEEPGNVVNGEISGDADRSSCNSEIHQMVAQVTADFQKLMTPQAVYALFPLEITGDFLRFGREMIKSRELSRYLKECHSVFLFAATIGPKIDREIQKMQRIESSRAVIMQAVGAMFIEKYCDLLCTELKNQAIAENMAVKNRFSPGFSDVGLEVQKIFFSLLDCKKIGLTLMESLIMAPEKSVTAFVGVKNNA